MNLMQSVFEQENSINEVERYCDCTNLYRGVRHAGLCGLQRDKADTHFEDLGKDY